MLQNIKYFLFKSGGITVFEKGVVLTPYFSKLYLQFQKNINELKVKITSSTYTHFCNINVKEVIQNSL